MDNFEEAERLHEIISRYEHEGEYAVSLSLEIASQEMLWLLESHSVQAKELSRLRKALENIANARSDLDRGWIVRIAKAALSGERE